MSTFLCLQEHSTEALPFSVLLKLKVNAMFMKRNCIIKVRKEAWNSSDSSDEMLVNSLLNDCHLSTDLTWSLITVENEQYLYRQAVTLHQVMSDIASHSYFASVAQAHRSRSKFIAGKRRNIWKSYLASVCWPELASVLSTCRGILMWYLII